MPSEFLPKPTLGRLEKVDLHTYWSEEHAEFIPWLAQAENIQLLGEAIDIALEPVESAQDAAQAQIVCRDATGNSVLIESQLAPTDSARLGQLLVAMADLQAVTVIWIASHFTAEHLAALNWLNHISQASFFGLELELWRIGESALAPKFNLVLSPTQLRLAAIALEAPAEVQAAPAEVEAAPVEVQLTEAQQRNLEFWAGLCQQLERRGSIVKPGQPLSEDFMSFAIGRAGFRLYARADAEDLCLSVELLLSREDAKPHFHLLEEEREAIETEMGTALEWDDHMDDQACAIYCVLAADPADREHWSDYYQWLCAYLEQFHEVFGDRIKRLNASSYQPLPDYSFNPLKTSALPGS